MGSLRAGEQQLVPRRLPSCGLNGALCRAGGWPALPGLPWGVPACPSPSVPRSPGHHQGPVPEGEVQPAQGVRGAGLPARHVHQPQEAGAQVGRSAVGGKGGAEAGGSAASPPSRIKPLGPKAHGGCKPCHAAPVAAVCGSDGHTYSSAVRTAAPAAGTGGPVPRVPPPTSRCRLAVQAGAAGVPGQQAADGAVRGAVPLPDPAQPRRRQQTR